MIKLQFLEAAKTKDETMVQGSIKGLVNSLGDRHSRYLTPDEVELMKRDEQGSFCGIGAVVKLAEDGTVQIERIMDGSPAEKCGLKEGDLIQEVDGTPTKGLDLNNAVLRIRGRKGTPVKLTVGRQGWAQPRLITVVRDQVKIELVTYRTVIRNGRKIATIKFSQFSTAAMAEFMLALMRLRADEAAAVVIDLRDNPGGGLFDCLRFSSVWIGCETVTHVQGRDGVLHPLPGAETEGLTGRLTGMPTVVLINEHSASAAEMTAGCLKDYDAATLVGQKSYGKGSVQAVRPLSDGGQLRLTIEHFFTPKKREIHGIGISPHFTVKMTQKDREAKRDPQMEKALEILGRKK
jgi:carboxyl-terminal processing protease